MIDLSHRVEMLVYYGLTSALRKEVDTMRKSRSENRMAREKRKLLSGSTTPAALYYLVLKPLLDLAIAWLKP